MSLRAIKLPFPATFQDLGRRGWLRYGVPRGGAFDYESLILANCSLGNDDGAAGLEITLLGGTFEVLKSCSAAIAGAESAVSVNGAEQGVCNRLRPLAVHLEAGDRIEISPARSGLRAYLCIGGGFSAKPVLGSASGQAVIAGQILEAGKPLGAAPLEPQERAIHEGPIRIVPGPHSTEYDLITLTSSIYTLTNHSNRVGLRLDGPTLTPQTDRPSEPACIGAIQISNSGQPIILGPDGPTIGGYPIVSVVRRVDLSRLGQFRPGDEVRFELS